MDTFYTMIKRACTCILQRTENENHSLKLLLNQTEERLANETELLKAEIVSAQHDLEDAVKVSTVNSVMHGWVCFARSDCVIFSPFFSVINFRLSVSNFLT